MTFKKYLVLFYAVPFLALLFGSLNFLIGYSYVIPLTNFLIFLFLNLVFLFGLSLVVGNILIEVSLEFFSKGENSKNLASLYKSKFMPIKPLIFVAVFVGLYVFLAIDLTNLNFFKMAIMLIPCAALIINSKNFLSGRIMFISGKYISFNGKLTEMFSYNLNIDDEIVFITSSGDEMSTRVHETDIDFEAFKTECEKNGLKSMIKKPEKEIVK